jgi:type VI secretion system protein ImpK
MNALTPSLNEAALLEGVPGTSRVREGGIRDLLRDTALLVTTLSPGGRVQDAAEFRARCRQLIEHFSNGLERRGYPHDVRHEALVAQCGLLDEIALRFLPNDSRAGWELKPLQVERFNLHDAGERVIDCIEVRMRESSPQADLLECYASILAMGFVGRYAREGEAKRTELIASLNARLESLRASTERPFIADRARRGLVERFYRLSPWAMAGLACVAAGAVWMLWAAALDIQLAHWISAKVGQP